MISTLRIFAITASLYGLTGCIGPVDAGYQLTIVNREAEPVAAYVNGFRRGVSGEMVGPCSIHVFSVDVTAPGSALGVHVVDMRGATVFDTSVTPRYQDGLAKVQVVVPGQCTHMHP